MRGALLPLTIPAIAAGASTGWAEAGSAVIEEQHDSAPLMTNDKSLPMIERFGVCWRQTGATLERTLHDHRHIPGQRLQLVPALGPLRGLVLGEALQRSDCDLAMGFQPLRELGFVQSGKPGSFLASMFRGHDQQKEEVTRADVLKT